MSLTTRIFILLPLITLVAFLIHTTNITATEDIPPTVVYPTLADLGVQVEDIRSPQWPITDSKMAIVQAETPPIAALPNEPFPLEPFAPTGHFEMLMFGTNIHFAIGADDMLLGYSKRDFLSDAKGILSTNKGISWRMVNNGLPSYGNVYDAAMPPTPNEPIFVVTVDELFRSLDHGRSWEHVAQDVYQIGQSLYSPTYERDNLIFALGRWTTLARSTDKGDSWVTNEVPMMSNIAIAPDFADRPIIIGHFSNVVYHSADGGYGWQIANEGLHLEYGNSILEVVFSPNHAQDNSVFAITTYGVYLSQSNGREWQRWLPYSIQSFTMHPQYPYVPTFFIIATVEAEGELFDVLLRSDDNGLTFHALVVGATDFALSQTYGVNNNDLYAMIPQGFIHSTDNGETWYIMSQSIGKAHAQRLIPSPNITNDRTAYLLVQRFIGDETNHELLQTKSLGFTWQELTLPKSENITAHLAISPQFAVDKTLWLLAFTYEEASELYRSTDGGQTWALINHQLPFGDATSFQLSPNYAQDQTIFVSSYFQFAPHANGVFRSQDGGQTWQNLYPNQFVLDFKIAPQYPTDPRIFASVHGKGIFVTNNGGATWNPLPHPYYLINVNIALSPNFAEDNTLFAMSQGSWGNVWRSVDAGANWELISNEQMMGFSQGLALSPQFGEDQTAVFSLEHRGVFMTEDGGDHWFPLDGINLVDDSEAAIFYWQGRPYPILFNNWGYFFYVWPSQTSASFGCQNLTLENEEPQTAHITVGASTTQPFGWHVREESVPWLAIAPTSQMAPAYPQAQVQINTAEITAPTTADLTVDVYLSYRQKQTHTVSAFVPCFGQNLPLVLQK